MKTICFPSTSRVHLARQRLLITELEKYFRVDVFTPKSRKDEMAIDALQCASEFVEQDMPDALLARGDRYEILPIVTMAAYRRIPIIHIEGGDLSGAIDNRVRYAITHLSDYHFCTNEESHQRLIQNGVSTDKVWNFGSLDVEFAKSTRNRRIKGGDYIMIAYHPIPEEDVYEVEKATRGFRQVSVVSNKDYGKKYGKELYSPEDYINLMRYAKCLVGNSSSFLKEASILGVPVVLVGERQNRRLLPKNVLNIPCESGIIREAIRFQMKRKFEPDMTYYQPNPSKRIANKIKEIL